MEESREGHHAVYVDAGSTLLYCESRLGLMAGLAVQELVESTTGEPCPCKAGHDCPLVLGRSEVSHCK